MERDNPFFSQEGCPFKDVTELVTKMIKAGSLDRQPRIIKTCISRAVSANDTYSLSENYHTIALKAIEVQLQELNQGSEVQKWQQCFSGCVRMSNANQTPSTIRPSRRRKSPTTEPAEAIVESMEQTFSPLAITSTASLPEKEFFLEGIPQHQKDATCQAMLRFCCKYFVPELSPMLASSIPLSEGTIASALADIWKAKTSR